MKTYLRTYVHESRINQQSKRGGGERGRLRHTAHQLRRPSTRFGKRHMPLKYGSQEKIRVLCIEVLFEISIWAMMDMLTLGMYSPAHSEHVDQIDGGRLMKCMNMEYVCS